MTLLYILDLAGTFFFAVSGALSAMSIRLDPFGVLIIAFVTAVGGGTVRDLLIGQTPTFWMRDTIYMWMVLAATILTITFRNRIEWLRKNLYLFDTLGLATFTIIGVEKGITANLSPVISIILGTMTGVLGGVIRDTLTNKIPIIFHKEIYATACILGSIAFIFMHYFNFPHQPSLIVTALIIIAVRLAAVKFHLVLPYLYKSSNNNTE